MNVIEFYNAVLEVFDAENLMVAFFVDPTLNNEVFPGIQFIYPNGAIYPPLRVDADTLVFTTPLEGPFYGLNVVGYIISDKSHDKWWRVKVVVELPDGELASSYPLHVCGDKDKIKEGISHICGNNWYSEKLSVISLEK
jgi:hypothetical protein